MSDQLQETPTRPKRPRPVLSCLECRRKKLKCDRLLPCQQCLKLGQPSTCVYAPGQEPELRNDDFTSLSTSKRLCREPLVEKDEADTAGITSLNDRVRKLEEALRSQQSMCSSPAPNSITPPPNATRLHPPTRASAPGKPIEETLLVPAADGDLSIFTKFDDAIKFTRSLRRRAHERDIQTISSRLFAIHRAVTNPVTTRPASITSYTDLPSLMYLMVQLLPIISTRNKLIEIYFENFERTVRIIHKPRFISQTKEYDQGLLDEEQVEYFIPMLIGVIAMACTLNTYPECDLPSFNGDQNNTSVLQLMDNWYDLVLRRDRISISAIQVKLLSMQTQRYQGGKATGQWITSALLVRQAMVQNLHKQPPAQMSNYEAEMRCGLWLAILEQDLTLAISCEMPPICPSYDLRPPANCDDHELSETSTESPPCYPTEKWTDALCLHILGKTFNQRLEAYKHRFGPLSSTHYAKTIEHVKSLELVIRTLPPLFRLDHLSDQAANTPGRLMAQMDLDISLRRPLIAICAPYARAVSIDNDFREARIPWMQSQLILICFQDLFDPLYPALDVPKPRGYWNFFHNAHRYDVVRSLEAMLAEAHYLKQVESIPRTHQIEKDRLSNDNTSTRFMRWDLAAMMKSLEDTLNPMKRRIGRDGQDLKSIVQYSLLFDCLKTPPDQSSDAYMLEGLYNLISELQTRLENDGHTLDTPSDPQATVHGDVEWLADFLSMD